MPPLYASRFSRITSSAKASITSLLLAICLTIIMLFASCSSDKKSASDEMPLLYSAPQTVALNTDKGYIINPLTWDSIQPLINSLGDTIKTGVPVPVKGKIIHPDIAANPKIIPAGEPMVVPANPNVHKIPEALTVIPVNKDLLKTITSVEDSSSLVFVNSFGDTVPRGVPIPAKGKVIPCKHPRPVKALPLRMKDNAIVNLSYLDVGQGMNSSIIISIMEDSHGNLWFGTDEGGVSMYNGNTFTHFTQNEGLVHNYVSCILEDRNGNLWFGTWGGVSMYNGEFFTNFTDKEGYFNTLILFMLEDRDGNIWFGTDGSGVSMYNGKTFTHFSKNEGLSQNVVHSILEDRHGNLWFGTNMGVSMYDGKTFTHYRETEGLSSNMILSIQEDSYGNLWFGTNSGVSMYNGESFTLFTQNEGLSNNVVNSIQEDSHGNIWFGTNGGVSMYNGESFTNFTKKEGLSSNRINSILEDSRGNLWFATYGGVNMYKPESFIHFPEEVGSFNNIRSILEDRYGNLWFGTNGGGVIMFNGETFAQFTEKAGLSNNIVNSILEDRNGNLWFGTYGGGICMYNGDTFTHFTEKEGLSLNYIRSMMEDSHGNLWIGTGGGGVSMYDGETFTHFTEKEGLSDNYIRSILEDSGGNLWFGTWLGGACMYDGETFTHFTEKEGLGNNNVRSILEDSHGNLWFGTGRGGASMYNGKTFTYYTQKEGLSDNWIAFILEDYNKNIWLGTRKGLNRLTFSPDSDSPVIHTYDQYDGLKDVDFHRTSVLLDSKNRIWCGSYKDLNMLDINNLVIPVESPANLQLNRVEVNEQFIDYRHLEDHTSLKIEFDSVALFSNYPLNLKLPYKFNHLSFYFSAIDWSSQHKIRYSYKMDGIDNSWSMPTEEAYADYRNMPHGTFTFVVRAIGEAQKWSNPYKYTFTIKPPWWRTWWAIVIDCLLAISILIMIIRFRERNLKQRALMLEQQVQEKTHQILEQRKEVDEMKSRFYTNISHEFRTPLALLISPIEDALKKGLEKTEVSKRILSIMHRNARRLQNLINQLLDISRIESGKMELQLSKANLSEFVRVMASSFYSLAESRKIQYQIDIEPDGEDSCFDTDKMEKIIMNLLSNAFKFCEDRGNVCLELAYIISADEIPRQAVIRVKDDGRGIAEDKLDKIFDRFYQVSDNDTRELEGSGIGLALTRELLELMHGSIEVESTPGKGTSFQVTFPVSGASFSEKEIETMTVGESLLENETVVEIEQSILPENETKNNGEEVILVVEDNPDLRSYIIEKFSKQYKVIEAENGEIALRKAIEQIPDLVITDLMMPVMGGLEFCRKLKEHPAINHIPVIMLTAKADKDSRIEGLEAAADDYISKPFDSDLLLARARNLITQRNELRKHFEKELVFSSDEDHDASPQFKKLREIVKIIDSHLDDSDFELDSMATQLHMSRRGLFRKIKAVSGMTPHELVRIMRMKRAATLLRKGELNVTEVMYQVGMKNLSHFAASFRKYYGVNPGEYRSS